MVIQGQADERRAFIYDAIVRLSSLSLHLERSPERLSTPSGPESGQADLTSHTSGWHNDLIKFMWPSTSPGG